MVMLVPPTNRRPRVKHDQVLPIRGIESMVKQTHIEHRFRARLLNVTRKLISKSGLNMVSRHFAILLSVSLFAGVSISGENLAAQEADSTATFTEAQIDFFENAVRPLLVKSCYECHGPERQESDLRLDSRELVLQGGASGEAAAIVGKPDESLLVQAVKGTGDYSMPPEETLSDEEIAILEKWVATGMAWPQNSTATPMTMSQRMHAAQQEHWSFQPIRRPAIPVVNYQTRQPVDNIVRNKWSAAGIEPTAEADRATLIRRLYFDLLGLPPTFAEVQAFVEDDRVDAYEQLVDRLLSSPRYGERWGRHWMDVARYADTSGYAFQRDRSFPFAYTYRDYVIESFNEDLPYNQFVREQLAADQLVDNPHSPKLAALGFLTVGRRYNNAHEDINDRIDAVTRGFLGLTVACARCHDHKYDAIPTEDYYALYGVFASSTVPDNLPLIGDLDKVQAQQNFEAELAQLNQQKNSYISERTNERIDHVRSNTKDYLYRILSKEHGPNKEATLSELPLYPLYINQWEHFLRTRRRDDDAVFALWEKLQAPDDQVAARAEQLEAAWRENTPEGMNPLVVNAFLEQSPRTHSDLAQLYGGLFDEAYRQWKEQGANDQAFDKLPVDWQAICLVLISDQSPTRLDGGNLDRTLTDKEKAEIQRLTQAVVEKEQQRPESLPRAMVIRDLPKPVEPVVFQRGDPRRRGDRVPRRFVALIDEQPQQPFETGSGRLDLADRIVEENNPLTARVIANRVWMHFFDQSLVESPSDFGVRTPEPVQSELLDYLASYLIEHDWSLKDLQRTILLSSTYRETSSDHEANRKLDPDNQLLWRTGRKRLEFEPLRDSILYVAGQLDSTMHGPAQQLLGQNPTHRRAVYGWIDRQDLPNLLRVFDFASPDQSSAGRTDTIVPQQALFLMNSPFSLEAAQAVSTRAPLNPDAMEESIDQLFKLVYSRAPTETESQLFVQFLQQPVEEGQANQLDRWTQLTQLMLMSNEFTFVD